MIRCPWDLPLCVSRGSLRRLQCGGPVGLAAVDVVADGGFSRRSLVRDEPIPSVNSADAGHPLTYPPRVFVPSRGVPGPSRGSDDAPSGDALDDGPPSGRCRAHDASPCEASSGSRNGSNSWQRRYSHGICVLSRCSVRGRPRRQATAWARKRAGSRTSCPRGSLFV